MYEEFQHRKAMTAYIVDAWTSDFIRFVGMSSSNSAFRRWAGDLVKRQSGICGQCARTLVQLNPFVVAESTHIYTFPMAATIPFRNPKIAALQLQDSSKIDLGENALIVPFYQADFGDRRCLFISSLDRASEWSLQA